MMNNEQVEGYVNCLLESWAVHDEGNERGVYQVLHDLLTAWAYYELMSADERTLITALCKKMQHHFDTKCMLNLSHKQCCVHYLLALEACGHFMTLF